MERTHYRDSLLDYRRDIGTGWAFDVKVTVMHLAFAQGKTYGMVGLGKTGQATAAALIASGARVFAWDDGEESRNALLRALPDVQIAPCEAWPWHELSEVVLSPGVPTTFPKPHAVVALAQAHNVGLIGDIELLYSANPHARYIAITGTNGKSTTTSLIAHIIAQAGMPVQVGGNLGTAVLSLEAQGADGVYVLELSSYQLELVRSTKFTIAVLLNFSPDHLDRHGTMAEYIAAKRHIFDRQDTNDTAIIGVDDAYSEAIAREMLVEKNQRVIPISVTQTVGNGLHAAGGIISNALAAPKTHADIASVKALQGAHNWQNATAAYAACFALGMAHETILAGLQTFPGLAHRMQWLGEWHGVAFVNDSKATNADATEKALLTYENIYWILGGVAKEGGIAPLQKYFHKIRRAYLIGEASKAFAHMLGDNVKHTACGTLDIAVAHATRDALADAAAKPVILLSPACASFDQFKNFEQRGEHFMALVDAVKRGEPHAIPA
jgi:UDP-N-acetylmuramoylalanine--D-glutamate ligase